MITDQISLHCPITVIYQADFLLRYVRLSIFNIYKIWTGVMWSTLKISSGAQLGHATRDIPTFDTVSFHSNLSSLRRKYLSDVPTDKIVLSCGPKISKRPSLIRYLWLKNKERKCHFRFVEWRFWKPLIAPEARKERSCQSFSASHIGPRADCPFHRPAFFRPGISQHERE